MMKIYAGDGSVVLEMNRRKRDHLFGWKLADVIIESLREAANVADQQVAKAKLVLSWEAKVESYDGFVALQFVGPEAGVPKRIPMPPDIARKLADLIEWKSQQAAYKMRFEVA